jgi:tetratricopeptide (TPR) repeat protein
VTQDNAPLPAALILRHLFDLIVGDRDASDFDHECTRWLERGLALDPDDRDAHLKLIRIHRRAGDAKAARAAMETALARFANDPVLLLEAVEIALAGSAFKKAVTLAKRLLELDPINSKVRAVVGQAHLSHARKQIRSGRPDMAGKELDLADEWLAAANERSISKMLRGLSTSDATATALLREAAAELGGHLLASFHLTLESTRIGSPPSVALQRAGVSLSGPPSDREVLAVMQAINALGKPDRRALGVTLDALRLRLQAAAGGTFSEAERISICETLLRLEERQLLLAYALAGLRHWPGRPLFVYLTSFARYGSEARFAMSAREEAELERALRQAVADGDQRTAERIRCLLEPPEFDTDEDADDFADQDECADPARALVENPRALLEMMISLGNEQSLIDMARSIVPASDFRQLVRAAGGNRKRLARMLIDHLIDHLLDLEQRMAGSSQTGEVARPTPRAPRNTTPDAEDRQKGLFDD